MTAWETNYNSLMLCYTRRYAKFGNISKHTCPASVAPVWSRGCLETAVQPWWSNFGIFWTHWAACMPATGAISSHIARMTGVHLHKHPPSLIPRPGNEACTCFTIVSCPDPLYVRGSGVLSNISCLRFEITNQIGIIFAWCKQSHFWTELEVVKTCLVACFWLSDFAVISRNATMTFFMRYGPAPRDKKCHSEHQTLFHFTGRSGNETSFLITSTQIWLTTSSTTSFTNQLQYRRHTQGQIPTLRYIKATLGITDDCLWRYVDIAGRAWVRHMQSLQTHDLTTHGKQMYVLDYSRNKPLWEANLKLFLTWPSLKCALTFSGSSSSVFLQWVITGFGFFRRRLQRHKLRYSFTSTCFHWCSSFSSFNRVFSRRRMALDVVEMRKREVTRDQLKQKRQ